MQAVHVNDLHLKFQLGEVPSHGPDSALTAHAGRRDVSVIARQPNWRLRRFAAEMERLRGALEKEEVKAQTRISPTTLWRIENAVLRPRESTVIALLNLYRADDETRHHVLDLWEEAKDDGAPQPFAPDLRDEYNAYIGIEAQARTVCNYQSSFVPGLLQTEEYTRAVIHGVWPEATTSDAEQHVKARMERQGLLTKDDPLHLTAVIDEAALRRHVGGPQVMAEQMRRLQATAGKPHIELQVIPSTSGAHPGMPGAFALLAFPGARDPEVVYIESAASDLFLDKQPDVDRFTRTFKTLREIALSSADSLALIATIEHELTRDKETPA